ncbi:uncharacterized protein METZ01_LOCUS497193, partial [marine metagenome]
STRFLPALRLPGQVIAAGSTTELKVARAPSSCGYIAGAWYDIIFFIFPLLIAWVLGVAFFHAQCWARPRCTSWGGIMNSWCGFSGPYRGISRGRGGAITTRMAPSSGAFH